VPELLVFLAILGVAVMVAWLSPEALVLAGVVIASLGLIASFATGLVYHLALRAAIARSGAEARRWWWAPTRFHALIDRQGQAAIRPWFRAGATSFAFCGLGLFLVAGAIVKVWLLLR